MFGSGLAGRGSAARRMRAGAILLSAGLLASLFAGTGIPAAAATTINATGSVGQVYATGLIPGARARPS